MAGPPEVSEQLALLCDVAIEGDLREEVAELPRDELERVLVEAVNELVDATERAEKEIERFQRRLAERSHENR
jgi:hypothetical protein